MFTIAHLSDPHLAPLPPVSWSELVGKRVTGYINWQRRRRFIHDPGTLAAIVADLRRQTPDHIAVTGDIANIALAAEFSQGRDWLERLGSAQEVTFVPGNHDIYVRTAAKFAGRQWGAYMSDDDAAGGFPFVRRRGNIALIGLSTGVPTAPFLATGWLGTDQLAGLAAVLKRVIAAHGADLLLHGHDHLHMINWLDGPSGTRVPAVGVPSASAKGDTGRDLAAYNLYQIDGTRGAWQCALTTRGVDASGEVVQQKRFMLLG